MSKVKTIRELQNLTQEELSKNSGISVRTIQRIETGIEPKGHTRRAIAKALDVEENQLLNNKSNPKTNSTKNKIELTDVEVINYAALKLINLSSILFIIIPPLNILAPLLLMVVMKQKNKLTNQLISVQMLWTIIAPIVFMLGIFLKLGNKFTIVLILLIVLSNAFIILRNAYEIDKNKKLYFKLNFNMI